MFQSLIGIIEDFDRISSADNLIVALFQSLIGIIEDFDSYRQQSKVAFIKFVSIPDRDYRGFRPDRDLAVDRRIHPFQSLIGIIEDFDR